MIILGQNGSQTVYQHILGPFVRYPNIPNAVWPQPGSIVFSYDSYQQGIVPRNSWFYRQNNQTLWESKYSIWKNTGDWKSSHEILPGTMSWNLPQVNYVFNTVETRTGFWGNLADSLFRRNVYQFYVHNFDGIQVLEKTRIGKEMLVQQPNTAFYQGQQNPDIVVFKIPRPVVAQPNQTPSPAQQTQIRQIRPPVKVVGFRQQSEIPRVVTD